MWKNSVNENLVTRKTKAERSVYLDLVLQWKTRAGVTDSFFHVFIQSYLK